MKIFLVTSGSVTLEDTAFEGVPERVVDRCHVVADDTSMSAVGIHRIPV